MILENRQFNFLAKIPFNLVAETAAATKNPLQIPEKWSILKIVRTYFAADLSAEASAKGGRSQWNPRENSEILKIRSSFAAIFWKTAKEPGKNIGSNPYWKKIFNYYDKS